MDKVTTRLSRDALVSYLRPFPGRLTNTIRIVAISLLALVIGEVFRLPEASLIAYVPIVFFKDDADATTLMAPFACIAVLASIGLSILIFMLALSEPALRMSLTWLVVLVSMFLSRTSSAGQLFLIVGLLVLYTQKVGDDILSTSLSGNVYSNNTDDTLPAILFMPPEEALLHTMLYLGLAFLVPTAMIFLVNRLSMRDPIDKLRDALAVRFATMAAFCEGQDGSRERLLAFADEGTGQLASQNELAGKVARRRYDKQAGTAVIEGLSRLTISMLAWLRVQAQGADPDDLRALAEPCRRIERAVRADGRLDGGAAIPDGTPASTGAALPLVIELRRTLGLVESALRHDPDPDSIPQNPPKNGSFLKPDAFSNPTYIQFALKLTLATTFIYVFIQLTQWSKIGTAITTCFIIALDSVGQSARQARLRIWGAVVGGALGMATLFFLMPVLTDVGHLLLTLTPVLLAAVWIRVGSERIAYFGQQVAYAFLLTTIQDYGPTLDFQTARDRMIGIFVGEIVLLTIFSSIWPVTVADVVRENLSKALEDLAKLLKQGGLYEGVGGETKRISIARSFGAAIVAAKGALPSIKLEPEEVRARAFNHLAGASTLNSEVVTQIQALAVPTFIIARESAVKMSGFGDEDLVLREHREATSDWLLGLATWVRTGAGGKSLRGSLPQLADPGAGAVSPGAAVITEWFAILHGEVVHILDMIGPDAGMNLEEEPALEASSDLPPRGEI